LHRDQSLGGRSLFVGETTSDVMAAILTTYSKTAEQFGLGF
jgi:hypothetical protein